MPAKVPSINLYRHETIENTPVGRITSWAVTYGRYIMIGTEIVVLLAFISRFSLDRKLTDLREEVAQKQIILEANSVFEDNFKRLQKELKETQSLVQGQGRPDEMLATITQILPVDVHLDDYTMDNDTVTIGAVAASTQGFSQFLVNLQSTNRLAEIEVGEIRKNPLVGIQFKINAKRVKG